MRKYAAYVRIYVNFWICSIIFAYAILKMPLYVKNMRYTNFGKICNSICDRIFAHNQHPYQCLSAYLSLGTSVDAGDHSF